MKIKMITVRVESIGAPPHPGGFEARHELRGGTGLDRELWSIVLIPALADDGPPDTAGFGDRRTLVRAAEPY
ncbi:hypothetical protein [Streptomyces canus]|uniref:hypothetical protein n=1 Tax=Streptomyces canus TaxID=58343 RepID=UPI0036E41A5E